MQWLNELYQAASMARNRRRGRLPRSLTSMPIEKLKEQLELFPLPRRRRKAKRHHAAYRHHHAAGKYCARCGY